MQETNVSVKRQALKGQWQTPPVMQQFSSTSAPRPPTADPLNAPIPDSSAEYAKALQDAYRRGAQAASMSSQQINSNPNVGLRLGVPNPFQVNTSAHDNIKNGVSSSMTSNSLAQSFANAIPDITLSNTNRLEHTRKVSINAPPHRSISMPDMSKTEVVDEEEAKRLKRLARNRASARLRRLRKKNLVESYESEVGVLESSLAKLKAHKWGIGTHPDALIEALSMERGQQQISNDQRKELITSILSQQRDQVENVLDCEVENMVLGWIANYDKSERSEVDDNKVLSSLASELESVLELTPEQKEQLKLASVGIEDEYHAIKDVKECIDSLILNSWMINSGIEECTEQFMSNLNTTQVSKFMLWADYNSEAIDQLDYVNAPPSDSQPSIGPNFVFGVDESNLNDE